MPVSSLSSWSPTSTSSPWPWSSSPTLATALDSASSPACWPQKAYLSTSGTWRIALELSKQRAILCSRSTVVGILMALEMSSTFILSKLKPFLILHLGIDGLFLLFAGVLLLVILLTHTALPKQSRAKSKISKAVLDFCPKETGNICHKKSSIPVWIVEKCDIFIQMFLLWLKSYVISNFNSMWYCNKSQSLLTLLTRIYWPINWQSKTKLKRVFKSHYFQKFKIVI